MKNRKVLALIMAFAMIFTLIPGAAFAATSGVASTQPTVAPDKQMPAAKITLTVEDADGFSLVAGQTFTLQLRNATWSLDSSRYSTASNLVTIGTIDDKTTTASLRVTTNGGVVPVANVTVHALDEDYAEISVASGHMAKNEYISFELGLIAGDEPGEVIVDLIGNDSGLTSKSFVVGHVGTGKTTATVTGNKLTTTWRGNYIGSTIDIRENAVTSVSGPQEIRLTLPSGMSWNEGVMETASTVAYGGTMVDPTTIVANAEGRDLTISFIATGSASSRDFLQIKPNINIGSSARLGDITVAVRNVTGQISNATGLVIGTYAEESVSVSTVKEADLPEIIAGRAYDDYDLEITIEENMTSALAAGRIIEFEMPDYVQVATGTAVSGVIASGVVEVEYKGSIPAFTKESDEPFTAETEGEFIDFSRGDKDEDTSVFEYQLPTDLKLDGSKDKFTFTIPVTVSASAPAGDLKVKVNGAKAGINDTEIVVAKIVKPVTVTAKVADLRTGIQKQALGEIVIKENFVGAIDDRRTSSAQRVINVELPEGWVWSSAFDVEVVSGDLEIDTDKVKRVPNASGVANNWIQIPIKNGSVKEAAEIKLSDATLTLDRTPAVGMYKASIKGDAILQNVGYNKDNFAKSAASFDYINIITLADSNLYGESKFVIGANTYDVYVNGVLETRELDAPPYIDPAGRTMVSVKFAANSLGVEDQNIVWDANSKTATIFKGSRVVVFKSASNEVSVNGATIKMDVACANVNGRLFVPIAHLANALGTSYTWDATERSVTLLNQ